MDSRILDVERTDDLLDRALKLAGLVTSAFAGAGWELVVVGGSAVEFYTEGAYMSGDIDLCRRSPRAIPLRQAQEIMGRFGATGGPRSWFVGGLYVDLLGMLENEARTPCRRIETPYGPVDIIPPELVLVERSLLAFHPGNDPQARSVAKMLLAVCLAGKTSVDWDEVDRLARMPSFGIRDELTRLREEVVREL